MTTIDLNNKLTPPDRIAEAALDDPVLLQELLQGISAQAQKSARRENCSQAILKIAEIWPETLLPYWDYFVGLFNCENGSSKYVAVYVIADLSKLDVDNRWEKTNEPYFHLLDKEAVMVASHTALNAGKIALAKPDYCDRIASRLMEVDQTRKDPKHLDLVKAYVIEALDMVYEVSNLKSQILDFVNQQLQSESAKTQKLAKEFLKKHAV